MSPPRRLRLGMIGGGQGAFIGAVHRLASRLDDQYELVAGAFSSDPARGRASADALRVAPDRAYDTVAALIAGEKGRPDAVDVVAIVTPNHLHFSAARALLEAGIPVICDKPLVTSLADAKALHALAARTQVPFVVTHTYTGYPMVREARALVAGGALGAVRVVQVEYAQDWLSGDLEATGHKQADWRTDPARSGPVGAVGDIGTHAHNLAEFVSGLTVEAVAAELHSFVPGRRLDDDANMLLRLSHGARGSLWCSQVAAGVENGLTIRVFGETAGLSWRQEHPNQLVIASTGKPGQTLFRGGPGLSADATRATRVPAGHPEGYLEAFGQLYTDAAELIRAWKDGRDPDPAVSILPGLAAGVRGLAFIEAVVKSSKADAAWTRLEV